MFICRGKYKEREEEYMEEMNESNDMIISTNEEIKDLIYTIRGKQVMLDSDVARLYHCETKYLNRVVKRNIERFPEQFCFQITDSEFELLRCQFVTLNKNGRGQHRKYLPYVFTEYGITMLAGLLKSDIAIDISIKVVNTFIDMRNKFHDKFIIIDNKELYHCGASLKDLGKKCFGINQIEDIEYFQRLTNETN